MQVICSGCEAKIKVPDKAAGKKIKCPRCATILSVPKLETAGAEESHIPEESAASSSPAQGAGEFTDNPAKSPDDDGEDTGVTDKSSSGSKSPPPVKTKRPSWDDDKDSDDDDVGPPKKRRRDDDDDDDEERDRDDDDDRPRKRRRRDEDDDDDDLDVRKRRGRRRGASGMATASMITGIVSIVVGIPGCIGCCCGIFTALCLICGIVAVILGFMSNKIPGSEGTAMTGIICGFVGIAFGVIGIILIILSLTLNIGLNANRGWQMQNWPPPRINNPKFR